MKAKSKQFHFLIGIQIFFIFVTSLYAQDPIVPNSREQVETSIAINPTDSLNLIGAAITIENQQKYIGVYYSTNGGIDWYGQNDISGPGAADPMVAFDPDGYAYLLYQKSALSDVYIRQSADGGQHWGDEILVIHKDPQSDWRVDRPWLSISPRRNSNGFFNIYVSVTIVKETGGLGIENRIIILKSGDDSLIFFGFGSYIPTTETHYPHGSSLGIIYDDTAQDEKIVLAYAYANKNSGGVEQIGVKVFNSSGTIINSYSDQTIQIGLPYHNSFFVKNGNNKADSYPRVAVDNGIDPNTRGNVYVVWSGKPVWNPGHFGPCILMRRGREGAGGNWTWSVRDVDVDTDLSWNPAVNVNPLGVLSVLYYTSVDEVYTTPIYVKVKESYDGGNNWELSHLLNSGFTIPNVKTFLGDYQGLASWYKKGYGLWCEYRENPVLPSGNIQIYFGTRDFEKPLPSNYSVVKVDQVDASGQSFEKFERWNQGDFTKYKAAFIFRFKHSSSEVLRAKQDFKTGSDEKYNNWNANDYFLNHKKFDVTPFTDRITSYFKYAVNATIQTELISYGGILSDSIDFIDPWYFEDGNPLYYDPPYGYRNLGTGASFIRYESPLHITTGSDFKGVFLDQGWPNWNPPYYSVRAQLTDTIPFHGEDITWYFQGWEGDNVQFKTPNLDTTAVVFRTANAEARAQYKGHLVTGTDEATASNNGRRLASGLGNSAEQLYLVYEEDGNVYYTYSENCGMNWHKEKKIADSNFENRPLPSIFYECEEGPYRKSESGNVLAVVWDSRNLIHHEPILRYKTQSGNWQEEVTGTVVCNNYNTQPVVVKKKFGTVGHFYVLARSNEGLAFMLVSESINSFWVIRNPISGTTPNSTRPAMSARDYPQTGPDLIHLCWEDANSIYYSSYDGNSVSSHQKISTELWPGAYDKNPSITQDVNDLANILWQHFDGESEISIRHRRQLSPGGNWEPFIREFSLYRENLTNPSVGADVSGTQPRLYAAVQHGVNINHLEFDGDDWYMMDESYTGMYPSVNIYGDNLNILYTQTFETLPYFIKMNSFVSSMNPVIEAAYDKIKYREEYFNLNQLSGLNLNGRVCLAIGRIYTSGNSGTEKIPFYPLSDSLVANHFQQTTAFHVTPQMETMNLILQVKVSQFKRPAIMPLVPVYRLQLQNAAGTQTIAELDRMDFSSVTDSSFKMIDTLRVSLVPYRGATVRLNLESIARRFNRYGVKTELVDHVVFYPNGSTNRFARQLQTTGELSITKTPKFFHLYQNYPNPFNPTTTISFDLPEESRVSLTIYDITGRKIRVLADGRYPAGTHRVVWDGTDSRGQAVASGVYAYRLTAGKYMTTRKLLLIK